MNEADLVKIRGALEKETLPEALDAMEKMLEELGYRKPLDKPELREMLAELEHEQWWHWAKSLVPELNDILYKLPEGSLEADRLAARLARWSSLFKPYAELTEEQKDQDREWADKILSLLPVLNLPDMTEEMIQDVIWEAHLNVMSKGKAILQAYKELIIKENKHLEVRR